jgi:hypothetical protein
MPSRVVICCAERCISNCISTVNFAPRSCMPQSDKPSCHTQQQSPGLPKPTTVHPTFAPKPQQRSLTHVSLVPYCCTCHVSTCGRHQPALTQ